MIQELVNFMKILPDEFKSLGTKPREGLHIEVCLNLDKDGTYRIDTTNKAGFLVQHKSIWKVLLT